MNRCQVLYSLSW